MTRRNDSSDISAALDRRPQRAHLHPVTTRLLHFTRLASLFVLLVSRERRVRGLADLHVRRLLISRVDQDFEMSRRYGSCALRDYAPCSLGRIFIFRLANEYSREKSGDRAVEKCTVRLGTLFLP